MPPERGWFKVTAQHAAVNCLPKILIGVWKNPHSKIWLETSGSRRNDDNDNEAVGELCLTIVGGGTNLCNGRKIPDCVGVSFERLVGSSEHDQIHFISIVGLSFQLDTHRYSNS